MHLNKHLLPSLSTCIHVLSRCTSTAWGTQYSQLSEVRTLSPRLRYTKLDLDLCQWSLRHYTDFYAICPLSFTLKNSSSSLRDFHSWQFLMDFWFALWICQRLVCKPSVHKYLIELSSKLEPLLWRNGLISSLLDWIRSIITPPYTGIMLWPGTVWFQQVVA